MRTVLPSDRSGAGSDEAVVPFSVEFAFAHGAVHGVGAELLMAQNT